MNSIASRQLVSRFGELAFTLSIEFYTGRLEMFMYLKYARGIFIGIKPARNYMSNGIEFMIFFFLIYQTNCVIETVFVKCLTINIK